MKLLSPARVFVISLERSLDRRARIQEQFSQLDCFEWSFLDGVDGRRIPTVAAFQLCRSDRWSVHFKGSIGCFLSHVMCWEMIEAERLSSAVILEDDAVFPMLDAIYAIDYPVDFDMIFLNERMSLPTAQSDPACYPVIRGIVGHSQQDRFWGAGTDGYLLSASGAKKLLSAVQHDLFYGIIDGRLARYCTTQEDAMKLPENSRIRKAILDHHHESLTPAIGILRAFSVSPPLVRAGGFQSVRE